MQSEVVVIGHGKLMGKYLTRCHDSLNNLSLMYVDNRQSSPKICGGADHIIYDNSYVEISQCLSTKEYLH